MMHRLIFFIALLVLAVLAVSNPAVAQAQDAASVRAAIENHYAAIHVLDLESIPQHHLPEFTLFSSDGRLLMEAGFAAAAERDSRGLPRPSPR